MSEFKRPQNDDEFDANFAQIEPLMNSTEAHYASARCLFCFDAPCVQACPTGIDIPLFIRQINTDNNTAASKTIFDANYFGYSCGKVCPTEVLCEGACVYNHQGVSPVEIGRLQAYATASTIDRDISVFPPVKKGEQRVAVVGAGPAGISAACRLREMGYEVTIFEARDRPSGLTAHGVAPYKITDAEALGEVGYLQRHFGFEVEYSTRLTGQEIADLQNDYSAVLLGVGLGETSEVPIEGADLDGCFGAVEFIEDLRRNQSSVSVGNAVIVIGAGNTAMDAASESARMGAASVVIAYRRSRESMRAYEFEYDLAKNVGARGIFNLQPVAIGGSTSVEFVRFARTSEADGSLQTIPGSEFDMPCDMVIFATGQAKQRSLFTAIEGLTLDTKGRVIVDESGQTENAKFFAAGDAVNGGMEVVNAVAEGKQAAEGIHDYLNQKAAGGE